MRGYIISTEIHIYNSIKIKQFTHSIQIYQSSIYQFRAIEDIFPEKILLPKELSHISKMVS